MRQCGKLKNELQDARTKALATGQNRKSRRKPLQKAHLKEQQEVTEK